MKRATRTHWAALLAVAGIDGTARAQCTPDNVLVRSGAVDGDWFGLPIAIEGDTLVAGVPRDDTAAGSNCGTVSVSEFQGSAWAEIQTLAPALGDAAPQDFFGTSIGLSGDRLVVGTPGDDDFANQTGSITVFERAPGASTWQISQKVHAPTPTALSYFGDSVAIDGDRMVVGAPRSDLYGVDSGAAHVYVYDPTLGSWVFEQTLEPSTRGAGDQIGYSVAIHGDLVIVGAPKDGPNAVVLSGSAFVFERINGSWVEAAHLNPNGGAGDDFGSAVSIEGDAALVGAPQQQGSPGYAWVYRAAPGLGWIFEAPLTPTSSSGSDWFGFAVDLRGDVALVGAYGVDSPSSSGAAFVFEPSAGSGWEQTDLLRARDPQALDYFGQSVAIADAWFAVGAPRDDVAQLGTDVGSVHVFPRTKAFAASLCECGPGAAPCGNDAAGAGCRNSTGAGGVLTACGSASVAADDLVLTAWGLPSNQPGLLFMGPAQAAAPIQLGEGLRCVGSGGVGLFRYAPQSSGAGGTLEEVGLVGTSHARFPLDGRIQAGDTWYFQAWYRDPLGPCPTLANNNLSNALRVEFVP